MLLSMEWGSVFSTFPFVSANSVPTSNLDGCVNPGFVLTNSQTIIGAGTANGQDWMILVHCLLSWLCYTSQAGVGNLNWFVLSKGRLCHLSFKWLPTISDMKTRTRQDTLGTILIRWNDNKLVGWALQANMSQTGSSRFVNHNYLVLLYIRLTLKNLIGREHSINSQ